MRKKNEQDVYNIHMEPSFSNQKAKFILITIKYQSSHIKVVKLQNITPMHKLNLKVFIKCVFRISLLIKIFNPL